MNSNLFISKKNNRFIYKQLNSKFYGYLYSVSSIDDVKKYLNQLKGEYPDCSHICYSYRLFNGFNLLKDINISEFSNDDGEPRGSAGPPILKILKRYEMINTVIFIVRYFGGKKLGISGLIEAYSNSSEGLILNDYLKSWYPTQILELDYPYSLENQLITLFKLFDVQIKKQIFKDSINSIIELNELQTNNFIQEISNFPSCKIKKH
tara:strand:- start:46 stop:666 length:621 start_codon:yes stop_codon:yes gene_type:complete